jgi:predicted helicase
MQLGRLAAAGGDTVGIVASARCLGEGVDVPACDGVLFGEAP